MSASISGINNMFAHGLVPNEPLSCPLVETDGSIQITEELIQVYQEGIDALINQLGKDVYLNFDPVKENCPNCFFDAISGKSNGIYRPGGPREFSLGRKCPYCKGHGFLETPQQECVKCLLKWNPKDMADYGISVQNEKDIVRFKTYMYNYPSLVRATSALSNAVIVESNQLLVRLIKGPIPVGLRHNRYCISFWERI